MTGVESTRKKMGRPKGSKNKVNTYAGKDVADVCQLYNFNPTTFLITVANGADNTEEWSKDDRLRAAFKLHDAIHGNKGIQDKSAEVVDGQYEIVFVEGEAGFELPGEAGAEGAA